MLTKVVFLFFWSRSDSTKKLAACNHATLAHYILTPALYSDACAIYSDAYSITTIVVATVVRNPARCSLRARKFCRLFSSFFQFHYLKELFYFIRKPDDKFSSFIQINKAVSRKLLLPTVLRTDRSLRAIMRPRASVATDDYSKTLLWSFTPGAQNVQAQTARSYDETE